MGRWGEAAEGVDPYTRAAPFLCRYGRRHRCALWFRSPSFPSLPPYVPVVVALSFFPFRHLPGRLCTSNKREAQRVPFQERGEGHDRERALTWMERVSAGVHGKEKKGRERRVMSTAKRLKKKTNTTNEERGAPRTPPPRAGTGPCTGAASGRGVRGAIPKSLAFQGCCLCFLSLSFTPAFPPVGIWRAHVALTLTLLPLSPPPLSPSSSARHSAVVPSFQKVKTTS